MAHQASHPLSRPQSPLAPFQPTAARFYDRVNSTLHFNAEELAMLGQNGFVVTDRLAFEQFKRAYAYLYWKDLPILVTTDAILHALHQTYDQMVQQIEMTLLSTKLRDLLWQTRRYLRKQAASNIDAQLASYYADLEIYLSVPLVLLRNEKTAKLSDTARAYIEAIHAINRRGEFLTVEDDHFVSKRYPPVGIQTVKLFGFAREVDFTQFQARGHYDKPAELTAYFAAMMWLSLIDFRFVDYDLKGQPILRPGQLIAAHLLRDAINATGQRKHWEDINTLLAALVGWSDNVTLNGLDRFIADMGIAAPTQYLEIEPGRLLRQLLTSDYGNQQLRGQIQFGLPGQVIPRPISFMLMGQRFTIESYIMQEVIDASVIRRPYPSPLDVMAALGNDRATEHLQEEFKRYGYQARLTELRQEVSSYSNEYWENSFYNAWLHMIRALNVDTRANCYPAAMRSPAWADKTLYTQLASWTQLRHDNILYVKPPFEPPIVCEYPAGYVEPYPEFFAALGQYARFGRCIFRKLHIRRRKLTDEQAEQRVQAARLSWRQAERFMRPYKLLHTHDQILAYFDHLEAIAARLETLARKELAGEAFTEDDNLFFRSIVVRKYIGDTQYGGYTEEDWDGWYNDLLPFDDETPTLVADLYTNTNPDAGPVGVMHIGTGDPVIAALLVETEQGQIMLVGPVFTYYEHLEIGYPPHRLLDEAWYRLCHPANGWGAYLEHKLAQEDLSDSERQALEAQKRKAMADYKRALQACPRPPHWTASFRLPSLQPVCLSLPNAWDALELDSNVMLTLLASRKFRHFSMVHDLVELVRENPQQLLDIPGITEETMEKITGKLREKGYLQERRMTRGR